MRGEGWVLQRLHLPRPVWWQVAGASACPQVSPHPHKVEASRLCQSPENTVQQRGAFHLILSNGGICKGRNLTWMLSHSPRSRRWA